MIFVTILEDYGDLNYVLYKILLILESLKPPLL